MKRLNWITDADGHAYMRMRQSQNTCRSQLNPNENWMDSILKDASLDFTRQAIWGKRVFDFWNSSLGIAIEVDGSDHEARYDQYRDEYNFRRSGIVVLRVTNRNTVDAMLVINRIKSEVKWKVRKEMLGLNDNTKAGRRVLSSRDCPPFYLPMYLRGDLSFVPLAQQRTQRGPIRALSGKQKENRTYEKHGTH
jgi:very-short-patch-repair endonuclease